MLIWYCWMRPQLCWIFSSQIGILKDFRLLLNNEEVEAFWKSSKRFNNVLSSFPHPASTSSSPWPGESRFKSFSCATIFASRLTCGLSEAMPGVSWRFWINLTIAAQVSQIVITEEVAPSTASTSAPDIFREGCLSDSCFRGVVLDIPRREPKKVA